MKLFRNRKWSKKLGDKWEKGVPIEVLPIAYKITKKEIEKQLGGQVIVREGTEKIVCFIMIKIGF
jgi:ribose 5-phosphate isomerase A